jgi:hypothetical protein
MQQGKNMDMRIGGNIPFNASQLGRVVLSFVPKTMSLPPPLEVTYNVTIFNSTGPVYNRTFGDIDGILDLEIIPINKVNSQMQIKTSTNGSNNTTSGNIVNTTNTTSNNTGTLPFSGSTIRTTTYGPDINSPITYRRHMVQTFHIEGPILVEPTPYRLMVEMIAIDGSSLSLPLSSLFSTPPSQPLVDEFILPEKAGV